MGIRFSPGCPGCGCTSTPGCHDVQFPASDLVITLVRTLGTPQTAVMTWDGASTWTSACVGQWIFTLGCAAGGLPGKPATLFGVVYGPCPGGSATTSCSTSGLPNRTLTFSSATASPFALAYRVNQCSVLANDPYVYTRILITL